VAQIVELIDVLPTLLDLVGVAKPAEQHGKSLVAYLERPEAPRRSLPAFSEYGSSTIHTVLQDNWKLVHNPDAISPVCIPDAPPNHYPIAKEELYDLSRDPRERENLAAREPARVAALAQLIQRRFAGLKNRVQQQKVPEKLQEELRSLGYVAH
jgi:arylsulfatase A-like enzyme